MCLSEADVGTMQVFFDATKAEAEGYFGETPRSVVSLIEMLTSALCASRAKWEN